MESDRNRPESPRPADEIPAEAQLMRDQVRGFIERGLDPDEVGRRVVQAIRDRTFYILTHPGWNNIIRNRMENILAGRDPIGVSPDEGEFMDR